MLNAENARVKKRKHWLLFSCRWMVGSLAATFESTFPQEYFQKYFWWKSEAQKPRSRPYFIIYLLHNSFMEVCDSGDEIKSQAKTFPAVSVSAA